MTNLSGKRTAKKLKSDLSETGGMTAAACGFELIKSAVPACRKKDDFVSLKMS